MPMSSSLSASVVMLPVDRTTIYDARAGASGSACGCADLVGQPATSNCHVDGVDDHRGLARGDSYLLDDEDGEE